MSIPKPRLKKLKRKLKRTPKAKPSEDVSDSLDGIENSGLADDIVTALSGHADEVQTIIDYPTMQCVIPGCIHKAVGADDKCRRHGGDPVIVQNLLPAEKIPGWILANSKYKPDKHPLQFIQMSSEGLSEVEIAAEFKVSVGTLRGWGEKFSEFHQALDIGKSMYEAWWLNEGKANLDNRSYNVSLFKFLTGNKLGFSDKMETKNLNVSAGVLLVPGKADPDEWEAQGAELMHRRKNPDIEEDDNTIDITPGGSNEEA